MDKFSKKERVGQSGYRCLDTNSYIYAYQSHLMVNFTRITSDSIFQTILGIRVYILYIYQCLSHGFLIKHKNKNKNTHFSRQFILALRVYRTLEMEIIGETWVRRNNYSLTLDGLDSSSMWEFKTTSIYNDGRVCSHM